MTWIDYLQQQAQKLGVPTGFAYAIIKGESNGDPSQIGATNSNGTTDYGLFQLNSGGQGSGMTVASMLDPTTNIDVGLPHVASAYKAGENMGLTGEALFQYTANNSGHRSLDITHPGKESELYNQYAKDFQAKPVSLAQDITSSVSNVANSLKQIPILPGLSIQDFSDVKDFVSNPAAFLTNGRGQWIYYGAVVLAALILIAIGMASMKSVNISLNPAMLAEA